MRDQLQAIRWLSDNIAVFGGNPNKIAMVSQGAGAAGIAYIYQYDRGIHYIFLFERK